MIDERKARYKKFDFADFVARGDDEVKEEVKKPEE